MTTKHTLLEGVEERIMMWIDQYQVAEIEEANFIEQELLSIIAKELSHAVENEGERIEAIIKEMPDIQNREFEPEAIDRYDLLEKLAQPKDLSV